MLVFLGGARRADVRAMLIGRVTQRSSSFEKGHLSQPGTSSVNTHKPLETLPGMGTSLHADFQHTTRSHSIRLCMYVVSSPEPPNRTPTRFLPLGGLFKRSCQDGGGDALVGPNTSEPTRTGPYPEHLTTRHWLPGGAFASFHGALVLTPIHMMYVCSRSVLLHGGGGGWQIANPFRVPTICAPRCSRHAGTPGNTTSPRPYYSHDPSHPTPCSWPRPRPRPQLGSGCRCHRPQRPRNPPARPAAQYVAVQGFLASTTCSIMTAPPWWLPWYRSGYAALAVGCPEPAFGPLWLVAGLGPVLS